jgi:hypothetical protein
MITSVKQAKELAEQYNQRKIRELCNFQYWLGSNYTTLPTNSIEMTERASKYYLEKNKEVRYKCLLCGRDKFTSKSAHNCVGGFRKRKIQWEVVVGH